VKVNGDPINIIKYLYSLAHSFDNLVRVESDKEPVKISNHTWKLTFKMTYVDEIDQTQETEETENGEEVFDQKRPEHITLMKLEMHEVDEGSKYMVSATRLHGSILAFN